MFFSFLLQRSIPRISGTLVNNRKYRAISTTRPAWQDQWNTTKVEHSQFLSSASADTRWKDDNGNGIVDHTEEELKELREGEGKLLPTSSHLFKLVLPLDTIASKWGAKTSQSESLPTVLLLHPSQPLSHLSRLILASLPRKTHPETLSVSFQSSSGTSAQDRQQFRWSDSTDIGDFIRDAASAAEFLICVSRDAEDSASSEKEVNAEDELLIPVRVPTFADRTRYLRRRLDLINAELSTMENLKRECDVEAHRGARRMALGGFGMLVVYWAGVARLTFWDYAGLSTVVCGYLWFLYQGREVSYSSVLHQSVSKRRQALYKSKGLDIDRWADLVHERKAHTQEIGRIKEDYEHKRADEERKEEAEDEDKEGEVEAVKKEKQITEDEKL